MQINRKKTTFAYNGYEQMDDLINIYNETLYERIADVVTNYMCIGDSESSNAIFLLQKEQTDTNTQFIQKMMQACKLTESDYHLVLVPEDSDLLPIFNQAKKQVNIFFGFNFQHDGFAMRREFYKPFRFQGSALLLSNSIDELMNDAALKSKLWNQGLKALFNIA